MEVPVDWKTFEDRRQQKISCSFIMESPLCLYMNKSLKDRLKIHTYSLISIQIHLEYTSRNSTPDFKSDFWWNLGKSFKSTSKLNTYLQRCFNTVKKFPNSGSEFFFVIPRTFSGSYMMNTCLNHLSAYEILLTHREKHIFLSQFQHAVFFFLRFWKKNRCY